MPITNYTATVHGTEDDYLTGAPYDTVVLSAISALTGYASATFYILGGAPLADAETDAVEDPSGFRGGGAILRRTFPVKCYPFTFASGTQDVHRDLATTTEGDLLTVLALPFLWLNLQVDGRDYPDQTPAKVYPVRLVGYSPEPDYQRGRRNLSLEFEHRGTL